MKKHLIDVGNNRQLFIDNYLIDSSNGIKLKLHQPRPTGNILVTNAPWEGSTCDFHTVIKDGSKYKIYYRGTSHDGYQIDSLIKRGESKVPAHVSLTSYAESEDGINWTKPSLGIFEFNGSKDNSIVWMQAGSDEEIVVMVPFLDGNPNTKPDERYKAIVCENRFRSLIALASKDGIHWKKMQETPILDNPPFDTQNVPFWDPWRREYTIYTRGKYGDGMVTKLEKAYDKTVRWIRRATSPDFLNWSPLESIDTGNAPPEHMYTNSTIPYLRAPGVYLSFPRRFFPNRTRHLDSNWPGVSDAIFMSSRDGLNWNRTFLESYIRPGPDPRNWMSRSTMVSNGIVETGDNMLSMYVLRNRDFPTCHFERMTLRLDGFVSANASYAGGELTTPPLTFNGNKLELNYSTSAAGHISVEVQDANGSPQRKLSLSDCGEILGDETENIVQWRNSHDLGSLSGKPVRLRFTMKDADLYAFRFRK